jgi:hypothetical protein
MTEDFSEEKVVIREPAGTMLAIEQAAIRARLRPSDLVRHILLTALDADRVALRSEPVQALKTHHR